MDIHGLQTTIKELRKVSNEYKDQLKRMKIKNIENYPIIINIINKTNKEDEWTIESR